MLVSIAAGKRNTMVARVYDVERRYRCPLEDGEINFRTIFRPYPNDILRYSWDTRIRAPAPSDEEFSNTARRYVVGIQWPDRNNNA